VYSQTTYFLKFMKWILLVGLIM